MIGLGTNNYNVSSTEELAARREVLRQMPGLGGRLVDTAPAYGRSEEVIGQLAAEIGNREKLFFATKVTRGLMTRPRAGRCSKNHFAGCAPIASNWWKCTT